MLYTSVTLIIFLLQFLATCHFFDNIAPSKRKTPIRLLIGVAFYLVCFLQFFFYNQIILTNVLLIVLNAAFLLICYETSISRASIYSIFAWMVLTLCEITVNVIFPAMGFEISLDNVLFYSISQVIKQILYIVVLQISITVFKKFSVSSSGTIPAYFFIYPIVSAVSLVIIWELCEMIELSPLFSAVIILTVLLTLVSIILTYVFYEKDSQKDRMLISLGDEIKTAKINKEYNSVISAQNETLKQLIHDEKNHLEAIAGMTDDKKIQAYISAINSELIVSSFFGNTNNKLLDLLIGKYHILCKNQNVKFTTNIKTSNLSFIDDTDLTSLLSNILDNALEASLKSDEKYIELSINKINGFDVLMCLNSCDEKPQSRGEELASSKVSFGYHGNGMKIIKRITEKYNGNLNWEYNGEKREFTLSILI